MEKIGRFEIVGKLGRGAFGMVYKGRDPVINRMAAIKVMSEATVGDPELVARFKREAEAAGGLNHRNIVTIYDLGEHNGLPYIAMEFLEGRDLEKLLKEKVELSLEKKIEIMVQVGEGLDYAHSKGIVHRDIKPANVRLLDDLTVKIMDFGIAKMSSSDMTRTGQFMGTVNYMSPEQIKAKKIDGRSDLFAAGVMFYEMLSHRRPFPGDSITAVIYKIVNENPPPLTELHGTPFEWLEGVVFKCLEKDPGKRWASCKEFADALRAQMKVNVAVGPSAIDQTLIRAQQSASEGDIDAALSQLDSILEQDPENPTVLRKRRDFEAMRIVRQAESLVSSGRLEQARDELLKAKTHLGDGDEINRTLASVEDRLRGARSDSMFEAASRNLQEKRYEAAIDLLTQALKIDPYNEKVKAALTRASEEKRGADVAEFLADAQERHERGQLVEAKAQLQKALELDPLSRPAKTLLQTIERDLQHSKTRSAVEEAVFQSRVHLKKESFDDAIRLAEEAIALDPKNAEAKKALDEAKHGKLAADERKNLLQMVAKGKTQLAEKNFSEARISFQRALKIDPHLEEAKLGIQAADKRKVSIEAAARKVPVAAIAVAVVVLAAIAGFLLTRPSQSAKAFAEGDRAIQEGRLDDAYTQLLAAADLPGSEADHRKARERFSLLGADLQKADNLGKAKDVLDQVERWQGFGGELAQRYLELATGLRDRGMQSAKPDLIAAAVSSYAAYFKQGYDKTKQEHYETIKDVLAFGDSVSALASDRNRDVALRLELYKSAQELYTFVDDKEPTLGADQKRAAARADRAELSTVVDGVNAFKTEADKLLQEAQGLEKSPESYAQAIDRYRGVTALVARSQHLTEHVGLARYQEIADGGIRVLNQRLQESAASATSNDLMTQAAALEGTGNLEAARNQYMKVLESDAANAAAQAKVDELGVKLTRVQTLKAEIRVDLGASRFADAGAKLKEALSLLPTDSDLGGFQAELDRQARRAEADAKVATSFQEVDTLVAAGKLDDARGLLEKIRDSSVERSVIDRASQGIQGIRNRLVEAQIQPLLTSATDLAGKGKHVDALKALRDAERLNANYPGLQKLIGEEQRIINKADIERLEVDLKAAFDKRATDPATYDRVKRDLLKLDGANRAVAKFDEDIQRLANQAQSQAQAAQAQKQAEEDRRRKIAGATSALENRDPDSALANVGALDPADPEVRDIKDRASRLAKARDDGQAALQQARAALAQKKREQVVELASRAKELWPALSGQADQLVNEAEQIRDEAGEIRAMVQAGRWSDAAAAMEAAASTGQLDPALAGRVFFNASFQAACKANPCNLAIAQKWGALAAKYDDAGARVTNSRWALTVPKFSNCADLNLQSLCKTLTFK